MIFTPHGYQERAIDHIEKNESSLLILDMGLGKTVITLTAIKNLLDSFMIKSCLVVAPLRVAKHVWPVEVKKWDHLKDLSIELILGNKGERDAAMRKNADIHVINRDNVVDLIKSTGKSSWKWDCIIIDESSSFKNPYSKRFRALKMALPYIRRRILLTGTPSSNGLQDIWSQAFILDDGERLGRDYKKFLDVNFIETRYGQKPRNFTPKLISDKLSDISLSMQADDYLKMPERIEIDEIVELESLEMEKYNEFENTLKLEIRGKEINAANAQVLTGKLLQLANGAIYDNNGGYQIFSNKKLDALEEIIEAAQDDNILIAYQFKHDLERLKKLFGAVDIKDAVAIEKWNEGKIKLLAAHPASAGHGLNLQDGGRRIVWLGTPWSLELWQQFNARLFRQGQKKTVFIHKIIAKNTIDEVVADVVLNRKNLTQSEFIRSFK